MWAQRPLSKRQNWLRWTDAYILISKCHPSRDVSKTLKLTAKKSGAQFSKHYEENPSKIFATSLTYEELRKTMEVLIFKKYIQKSF